MHLPNSVRANVNRVVIPRLRAPRPPARRPVPAHAHRTPPLLSTEVDDLEPAPWVRQQERVLPGDMRERERQHRAVHRHLRIVRRQRARAGLHLPREEEPGAVRAFVGRDELGFVRGEDELGEGAGRAVRWGGLVEVEVADGVRERDEAVLRVDGEAAAFMCRQYTDTDRGTLANNKHVLYTVDGSAVEHAEATPVAVECDRLGKLAFGRDRVAKRSDVRRLARVDGEQRDRVRTGLCHIFSTNEHACSRRGPTLTVASSLFLAETWTEPWEKSPSGPVLPFAVCP